jgi:hypothetical protein
MENNPQKDQQKSPKESPNQTTPKATPQREGGDEALSNLTDQERTDTSSVNTGAAPREKGTGVGYTNEERVAEDGDGVNAPPASEDPAGSGIASKE